MPKSQVSRHKACSARRDPGQTAESFLTKKQKETKTKPQRPRASQRTNRALLQTEKPSVPFQNTDFQHNRRSP